MPDSVYRHKHVFNSKLFLKLMILVFIVSLVYVHTYNLIRVVMQVSPKPLAVFSFPLVIIYDRNTHVWPCIGFTKPFYCITLYIGLFTIQCIREDPWVVGAFLIKCLAREPLDHHLALLVGARKIRDSC